MRRILLMLAAVLIGIPAIYVGIAFGYAVLTPRVDLPAGDGITIYACDNGVHTDLVLPAYVPGMDWSQVFRPDSFAGPIALSHVSIGWGSEDFYVNTPTWADVRP